MLGLPQADPHIGAIRVIGSDRRDRLGFEGCRHGLAQLLLARVLSEPALLRVRPGSMGRGTVYNRSQWTVPSYRTDRN